MSETTQEKPKHTRRSRKSLVGQISDVLFKITRLTDKAFENESVKPAVLNALMAQLDTLRWLQERTDKAKEIPSSATPIPVAAKVETTSEPTSPPDPLDDVVAEMLRRHANSTPVPTATMTKPPAAPRAAVPVTDSDLLF